MRLLISLGIALAMWFYVTHTENVDSTHIFSNVPVDIRGLGSDLLLGNEAGTVSIQITASPIRMQTLTERSLGAYLDLTGLGPGVHDVTVKVDAPVGISGWTVSPETLQVELDSRVRKRVPVALNILDSPPFGYELKQSQVKPTEVTVSGPENLVKRVESAQVNISVEGKQATVNGTQKPVPVDANGNAVQGVTLDPESVSIVVPIELQFGYKAVPVKPTIQGQPAAGYFMSSIKVNPATVTIVGDPSLLSGIDFLSTKPVQVATATSSIEQQVDIVLPSGVSLYKSGTVTVTVEVTQIQTEMTVSIVPKVVGLSPDLYSIVAPNTVNVTVVGAPTALQNLQLTDIQVTLDVSGLGEGTVALSPKVQAPDSVMVSNTTPETVQVTLISAKTPEPSATPSGTPGPAESATSTPSATPSASATVSPAPTSTPSR